MSATEVPLWTLVRNRDEFGDDSLPILTVVSNSGVHVREMDGAGRAVSEDLSGYRVVRPGDLVVNKMWARFGAYGVAGDSGLVSPAYWVLRVDDGNVESRYLHYLLRSDPWRAEIWRRSKDLPPNGFDISWDQFRSLSIPLPPVEEQRRIADFLDDQVARINEAISLTAKSVELLHERYLNLRKVLLADAETDVVGPGIPWLLGEGPNCEIKPGARIFRLQRGVDLTDDEVVEGPYPVVTSGGVSRSHHEYVVPHGGVVVGRYGSAGSTYWIEEAHWPHNTSLYVKDYMGNDPRWVYHLLSVYPFDGLQARAAVPGVNRNDLAVEHFPWVPTALQTKTAERIDRLGAEIAALDRLMTAKLELLEERKGALITAAVTGELDVTTARPIGMGKWVPNVGAGVETPAAAQASSIGGIG